MFPKIYPDIEAVRRHIARMLLDKGQDVTTEKWQGTKGRRMLELLNVAYQFPMSEDKYKPNQPWADTHFEERISGEPLNPPPSHEIWPFAQGSNTKFRDGDKFSHTYPERFWPKLATDMGPNSQSQAHFWNINRGIRFIYGDLDDLINLLSKEPNTRQAYLPIWFPEDTGVIKSQRVPCSIGYHFQIRQGYLHCSYTLRSCDFLLHWEDDMFLAMRLAVHVLSCLARDNHQGIKLGMLNVSIYNLHCFYEGKNKLEKYG